MPTTTPLLISDSPANDGSGNYVRTSSWTTTYSPDEYQTLLDNTQAQVINNTQILKEITNQVTSMQAVITRAAQSAQVGLSSQAGQS
jgi:hypothetical protein